MSTGTVIRKEDNLDNVISLGDAKKALVATGGNGGDENWLENLIVGTCFLSRQKDGDKKNPFLNQYHVVYKTPVSTLLYVEMPDGTTARPHVDTLRFSRTMDLVYILGIQDKEQEHEAQEEERPEVAPEASGGQGESEG